MRSLLILTFVLVGCGSLKPSSPTCMGSLAEVAGDTCPATYEEALSKTPVCSTRTPPMATVGRTGEGDRSFFVLSRIAGASTTQCFYDLQTHALVGAIFCNDVPNFCSHTAHSLHYGTSPTDCAAPTMAVAGLSCSSIDAGP